ncbi:membrane protein insertion efficiency factor YidD [Geodermatophilus sp. DSM 44513]|uniref:membrane protein insertion efficiency factor YidD n=1 Tax=Geodermatophilus sp. DSM 44513 TaxID=1528104 RepID=UPI00127BE8FC|nr:membrane protein insertion efficiency factor YidD [Geodermatophilus sp. DSM 44513]WNV77547.1 membrane protein insertion efficiency factor YidD [Geodermatophilus sp. DSM 44513]
MVFTWSSGWNPRRRRRGPRYGPGYGYGRRYGPGYGYRPRRHDRDGSCLRDLLFLNTGCCLANAVGCSVDGLFLVPTTVRHVHGAGTGARGTRLRDRLVAAVRVYQREVSPRRPPSCRYSPTCSTYAVAALQEHGARRGSWLTVRRLVRCRPGAAGGTDPVPAAA